MKKKNLKRSIISLALIVTMITGLSISVFAGNGNISFGGMTVSWTISSSVMTTKLTNSTTATSLDISGYIYEKSGGTIKKKMAAGNAYSSKYLNFSSYPDNGYEYIERSENYMDVYINMSYIATYHPQP